MTTLPCRRGRRRSCTRNPHRPAAVLAPGWSQHTLTPPDIVNSLSEGRVPCGVHVFRSPNIHKRMWMQGPEAARRGAPRQTKASVILRRRQEDARTPRRPPPVGCPSEGETQPTDRSDISPRLPSVRWSAETSHETLGLQSSPRPQHRGKACGGRPLFRIRCRGGGGLLCPRPRRREGSAPHSPQSAIVMDGRVLCRNEW